MLHRDIFSVPAEAWLIIICALAVSVLIIIALWRYLLSDDGEHAAPKTPRESVTEAFTGPIPIPPEVIVVQAERIADVRDTAPTVQEIYADIAATDAYLATGRLSLAEWLPLVRQAEEIAAMRRELAQ